MQGLELDEKRKSKIREGELFVLQDHNTGKYRFFFSFHSDMKNKFNYFEEMFIDLVSKLMKIFFSFHLS